MQEEKIRGLYGREWRLSILGLDLRVYLGIEPETL
jgi:hypothetical protein